MEGRGGRRSINQGALLLKKNGGRKQTTTTTTDDDVHTKTPRQKESTPCRHPKNKVKVGLGGL